MFTGIIHGQGKILVRHIHGAECRFRIQPQFPLPEIMDGESIAVNGVCLSVENHDTTSFSVYASAETLSCTTLGATHIGHLVNLERALTLGDHLGGHLVSGHIDCLATAQSIRPSGQSQCCRFSFPAAYASQVIPKGSVALDGISLTVNTCEANFFEVNIIPDTQKRTTMSLWKPGAKVNMETDMIGKYVHRFLAVWGEAATPPVKQQNTACISEILARNGFL